MDKYPAFSAAHARERVTAEQADDDFVIVDATPGPSLTALAARAIEIGGVLAVVAHEAYREYCAAAAAPTPTRSTTPMQRTQPTYTGGHCTRCGHVGHNVSTCYAKRNAYGRPVGGGRKK